VPATVSLAEMTTPTPHFSHPKYRPDIDGLRAVAVLSVVAFHAFPAWMKGGFIGVDVFFVISGFLISTIIFENLDRGTFSFAEFYARRIKRIFPALLLVLIASFAFGWFALLADEFKQLGKHIAAGAGFISNLVLWSEAGYFDTSAETKPLLHLWSLGIEEQFYIIWPFALWFAWKRKFNLLTLTFIVALISFSLNLKGIKQDSVATFYSPQTRFWELLSGSILAWFAIYKKNAFHSYTLKIDGWLAKVIYREPVEADGKTLSNIFAFVGSLLLAYGFWRITKDVSFPGKWAIIPVLGAILIILAGPKAWINRKILSNKIAVWFGLISFPLYLWHWPLLSFARIVEGEVPSRSIRIAAVALSIVLAWLTYKFIERPIRLGMASRIKVTLLTLAMLLVGLSGLIVFQNDGFKVKGDYGHDTFFEYYDKHYLKCENKNIYNTSNVYSKWTRCWQTKRGQPDIVLLGDSHAEHLLVGLADSLKEKNIVFYIEGGRPALDDPEFKVIFEELKSANKGMYILITDHYVPDYANKSEKLQEDFDAALKYLTNAGHKVAIVGDVLRFDGRAPQDCLLQANRPLLRKVPRSKSCVISFEEAASQEKVYEPTLKNLATQYGIPYFSLSRLMCSETECSMINNGRLYYRDSHHLNIDGSSFVGSRLGNMITDSGFLK
jgi:peptidoglycan/LPS O-acetylase OafA/YrhL